MKISPTTRRTATSYHLIPSLTCFERIPRHSSTMARTYGAALTHLSSLQSNSAITSLFTPAPPTSSQPAGKAQDLNALAIPEMLLWLSRARLTPSDLSELKCIHVAGTKGKGSVCAYLTSILTQPSLQAVAGRVGTYTSPHLVSVRERIMLDGLPISQEIFTRYFFEVWDAFTAAARTEFLRRNADLPSNFQFDARAEAEIQGPATKPFYFRFLTIMAFHVFLREGVKSAVIECGIGGEYDATNVLPTDSVTSSVVSQLGIDHVGMLGGTLLEIAWHKAGIAKAGRKCFTRRLEGGEGEEAMRVIRERAHEKGADLVEVTDEEVQTWGGVESNVVGGLEGAFQRYNQALAVKAAGEHLNILGAPFSARQSLQDLPDEFRDGLRYARLRGRCETKEDEHITWLIDGAHTAESLREVATWFASKTESLADSPKVLIFNQQDRNAVKLLEVLYLGLSQSRTASSGSRVFVKAIFTRNEPQIRTDDEPERDLSVQQGAANVFSKLSPNSQTVVVDNVSDAVEEAKRLEKSEKKAVVLVTGSLHLVGAFLRILEPEAPI
ncbi:Mur ligase [Xylariales sp. AK1849]|nr:Mur ligase [Xylariales sp. AK1849]